MLGAVALVLVVWLLWPEAQGPQLIEQRTAWRESVEEAERRRAKLEEQRAAKRESQVTVDNGTVAVEPVVEPERRRIARPSELADRLDASGRRPGQIVAERAIKPAPARPSDLGDSVADVEPLPLAKADGGGSTIDPTYADAGEPSLEVAVLSSEALDAEPLPEVDLSDLDALVPLDPAEKASVAAPEPLAAEEQAVPETTTLPETAVVSDELVIPDEQAAKEETVAVLTPDAAAKPFVEDQDVGGPKADVKARPRDDAPTWLNNAVNMTVDDDRPIIAIVIDDLGLNRPKTAALNALPSPLTLAFLPYAGSLESQTEAAHAAGHELMVHLPMEPIGSDWPGPDALTTRIDQGEFVSRLEKNLSRFKGFVGVNNHMGSKLTADRSRMNAVMRELRERDVLFLDSKTSARSIASDAAGRNGVPNTTRDVFLDHVIDLAAIKRQLVRAERVARQSGSAVAIGHPHGATIEALREWLPGLESRGFVLAPISAVVARRACHSGVLIAADTCGRYLQARNADAKVAAAKGG
ncbi:MAG: divergent polysaccharide deacetylase family protein [Geminicoccaceae bacterium]